MPGTALVAPAGGAVTLDHPRDDLDDAVDAFAASAKSAATRRAYRSDARDFVGWCARQGVDYDPATPRTVCRYLAHLVARGLSTSTVDRRTAAITALHRAKGHDTPTAREEVRAVLAGIRNTCGKPPKKKRALTDDLVVKVVRKIGTDLAGLRDRAMIGLCFAAALRRSELVALEVADVELHTRGLVVTVRKSKTDQTGRGKRKGVLDGKMKVPGAVRAWLDAAGIVDGPLFRGCDRGKILDTPYDGGSYARMVKRRCAAVGLDPALFSGHSCRSGFATSADEHGADLKATSEHMGHAKLDTTVSYMQTADLFRKNAGIRDAAGKIVGMKLMEQYQGSGGQHVRDYLFGLGRGEHDGANYYRINTRSGAPLGGVRGQVVATPQAAPVADVVKAAAPAPKPVMPGVSALSPSEVPDSTGEASPNHHLRPGLDDTSDDATEAARKFKGTGGRQGRAVDIANALDGADDAMAKSKLGAYMHKGEWCTDFVNGALGKAGIKGGNAMAESFRRWGRHVDPDKAMRGDVMTIDFGKEQLQHTGFFTGAVKRDKDGKPTHYGMTSGNHDDKVVRDYWEPAELVKDFRRAIDPNANPLPKTGAAATNGAQHPEHPQHHALSGTVDFDHGPLLTAHHLIDSLHAKLRGLKAVASLDITHHHKDGDGGTQPKFRPFRSHTGSPAGRIVV